MGNTQTPPLQGEEEYNELELVCDQTVEQLSAVSLEQYDAFVLGKDGAGIKDPIFSQPSAVPQAAAIMAGARVAKQLAMDAEFACRNPLQHVAQNQPTQNLQPSPNTPPETCCGFPLEERVTQKGANAGRKYLRCDVCNAFKRWLDKESDADGGVRPARSGFQRSRSGSAGKRQIKYGADRRMNSSPPKNSNSNNHSNSNSNIVAPSAPELPGFQSANKRPKASDEEKDSDRFDSRSTSYSNSNSNGSNNNTTNSGGNNGRNFNPARSVVDAINSTGDSNSGPTKRKKFSTPARQGDEKKSEQKEHLDPIYEDERLKTIDPLHVENILNEVMEMGQTVTWDDIGKLKNHCFNRVIVFS